MMNVQAGQWRFSNIEGTLLFQLKPGAGGRALLFRGHTIEVIDGEGQRCELVNELKRFA